MYNTSMRELKLVNRQEYYDEINTAIAKGVHPEQLKEFIVEFDDYWDTMESLFSKFNNPNNVIYAFGVTYHWERKVVREIEIHGNQNFNQLAKAIVKSMRWVNDHMHGFYPDKLAGKDPHLVEHRYNWFAPYWEDDPYPTLHTDKVKICYMDYKQHPRIHMTFDYGDNHTFDIELLGVRQLARHEKQTMFPRVIKSQGTARAQYPEIDDETGEYKNIYKNWFD